MQHFRRLPKPLCDRQFQAITQQLLGCVSQSAPGVVSVARTGSVPVADPVRGTAIDSALADTIAARISESSTAQYLSVVAIDECPSRTWTARRLRAPR